MQVVAYVHGWDPADKDQSQGGAGAFSWWNANSNPPKTIPPRPGAGSAVDGDGMLEFEFLSMIVMMKRVSHDLLCSHFCVATVT